MTNKIDLSQFTNGKLSVAVESEIETKARIDRENKAAQVKLIRNNIDVALLCVISFACVWYGVFDIANDARTNWCRAALLAIISYLIGRQVGKSDNAN